MATNRVEILERMLQEDANNSFARYGLAMELSKGGDVQGAVREFKNLMQKDSNYVAAYYHCGQALEKLGDLHGAHETYVQGMDVCLKTGDLHTRSEIEAALNLLPI